LEIASRTGFIDHWFPDAFGFENEFNGFADRAVAGEGFRNVVGGLFYLGDGIATAMARPARRIKGISGRSSPI
jgi:hypothetical protein